MTDALKKVVDIALDLQEKRQAHTALLDALPMPKARVRKFPYESLDAAIKDGFKLLDGDKRTGTDEAFRILVKGWKTIEWRKAAEKNRETRDDIADGDVSALEPKPKRVRKPKAVATPATDAK